MNKLKIGDKLPSNNNNEFEVIEIVNNWSVKIKFNDDFGYESIVNTGDAIRGQVKNPYFPIVQERGYLGAGLYTSGTNCNLHKKAYMAWHNMISRCYDPRFKDIKRGKSYSNTTVASEWFNYQIFAEWYCKNLINIDNIDIKFNLDKDILSPESKCYSQETCCIIPEEINKVIVSHIVRNKSRKLSKIRSCLDGTYSIQIRTNCKTTTFSGFKSEKECFEVYLKSKENEIAAVISKYRNILNEKVYLALIEYASKNSSRISAHYDYQRVAIPKISPQNY